ncbi:MAG: ABC transporter ATP-binding protein [Betaproteobacteria bacterium]
MNLPGLEVELAQERPIPLRAAFRCDPGRVLALVGPSGSGKTTVLRAIAGLYRPAHGRVLCRGATWLDTARGIAQSAQRRQVGFVFQNYALFPHLSAVANIVAAMTHVPEPQRAGRARSLLSRVHLDGLQDRRPAELSGGQQQRVAVARALARDPAVLLLDEPFAAVDRVTRRKLYLELAEMRRELQMPVVLVTHDLDEAAMLADDMCILHRGATLQMGAPFTVMTRPASVLVARLVDLKNIFDARVAAHSQETGLTMIDWEGVRLEVGSSEAPCPAPPFVAGSHVAWAIPADGVIVHRRDRPSRGEHENPLQGVIADFVSLGAQAELTIHVNGKAGMALHTTISTHVAARNRLAKGEPIGVSLLASAIHLMPPTTPEARGEEGVDDWARRRFGSTS